MKTIQTVELKKQNAEMWDSIDELTMDFVAKMNAIGLSGKGIPEGRLLDISKSVLEAVIPVIEKELQEEFTYVDCDM